VAQPRGDGQGRACPAELERSESEDGPGRQAAAAMATNADKENARRHRNSLRRHAGGERRARPAFAGQPREVIRSIL
jgi:hypothetical protein